MRRSWIVITFLITILGCLGGQKYVCYDKTIVEDKIFCPKYVCLDKSTVASPEACPKTTQPKDNPTTTLEGDTPDKPKIREDGPGMYYRAFHAALMADDFEGTMNFLSIEKKSELKDEIKAQVAVKTWMLLYPKTIDIIKEDIFGDKASVKVKGLNDDEKVVRGEALMVLEEGVWKMDDVFWGAPE